VLKDRRASDRERLVRRAELQRTTLLELQDALRNLLDTAFAVWSVSLAATADDEEVREDKITKARLPMDAARAKVQLLASRVEDEETRTLSAAFVHVANRVDRNDEEADEAIGKIRRAYSGALDRIGELIRARY
jgi:hypothetical protein